MINVLILLAFAVFGGEFIAGLIVLVFAILGAIVGRSSIGFWIGAGAGLWVANEFWIKRRER